ncbi:MAG: hypothetical protein HFJ84_01950 [Clostridiales bacterium]|jgi:hypothetical protein|nr:hypothetical protein [Clostridiales bacterium]
MKKVTILVCGLAIAVVLGLAACESVVNPPIDPAVSSQVSSLESQTSSTASSVISEPGEATSSTVSEITSTPNDVPDGYPYSIKRTPYTWEKGAKKYEVNYLRITGDKDNSYSKVNMLLKERAMRTANSFGYQPQYNPETKEEVPVTVTTSSTLMYRNQQFISVVIESKYTVGDGEPVSVFDTVNCYLDESSALTPEETEVTMQNSLEVKEEMADVLLEAIWDQGTPELQEYLTKERIFASLGQNPMFFTEKYMAISLQVPHELGDHVELKLNYPELAPFMKMNTIWRTFI